MTHQRIAFAALANSNDHLTRVSSETAATGYEALGAGYTLDIETMEKGVETAVATGRYTSGKDGNLTASAPLYWESTQKEYGFRATTGTTTLESDQTSSKKWIAQDRLDNAATMGYKKAGAWTSNGTAAVPLYLQHQRAWITVKLVASEGVDASSIDFSSQAEKMKATVFSYNGKESQLIAPLAQEDENGNTRYEAIVNPYDYQTNADSDIVRIKISGMTFSFACNNEEDEDNKVNYNLAAGKHLTITATLTRNSRKVKLSATLSDWTTEETSRILDDFGNAGDPIRITNRHDLISFLSDPEKNKAGNVGIVFGTNEIDLDSANIAWNSNYKLQATLNLSGATLKSKEQFVNDIASTGTLTNGTMEIGDSVVTAVSSTNHGTIENINVDADSCAYATVAGLVDVNYGAIRKSTSDLDVYGTGSNGWMGGIAAQSVSGESSSAVIDQCIVNGRVKVSTIVSTVKGGGIVGNANGTLTNNTFNYGITLLQDKDNFKNIVASSSSLVASGNAWPTKDLNDGLENISTELFDGIIDDADELTASTTDEYNEAAKRYRIARSFKAQATGKDLAYTLEGNSKTLSIDSCLFQTITGNISNLTLDVTKDIKAEVTKTGTDWAAALGYNLNGGTLSNVNVKSSTNSKIQAANAGGLIVWATNKAKIEDCKSSIAVCSQIDKDFAGSNDKRYCGGLVAIVANADIERCAYTVEEGTLNLAEGTYNKGTFYGGIVGGVSQVDKTKTDDSFLTLNDCSSWFIVSSLSSSTAKGSLIGYASDGTHLDPKCQGNWWQDGSKAVGTGQSVGRRNAVTPQKDIF